jgi:voltage-gated potassium channel
MMLLRLGRLARLALVSVKSPAVKRLLQRLGVPALLVGVSALVAAAIVERAEGPPDFPSYGDAVWWAMVTVTTVGYGDAVPVTTEGRVAAVMLMLVGVVLLGTVAASLASFFSERSGKGGVDAAGGVEGGPSERGVELDELRCSLDTVHSELTALRSMLDPGSSQR